MGHNFQVGMNDLCYQHQMILRIVAFKGAIKVGQIEARICPRTREQKVNVSHSRGARRAAAPLGMCPQ